MREAGGARPAPAATTAALYALTETQLLQIIRHAEAGYPEEVCGIVIGRPGEPETYQVHPIRNIANQRPQRDPAGLDRDARTAYLMDGLEQMQVLRNAYEAGMQELVIYHSHPDHEANFSAMDRDRALASNQEPLWPGATYLVVSVRHGRARSARYFVWDSHRRDFVATPARLPHSAGQTEVARVV